MSQLISNNFTSVHPSICATKLIVSTFPAVSDYKDLSLKQNGQTAPSQLIV